MPKRHSENNAIGDTRASTDKKRKLQARPGLASTEPAAQKTISELFTASQRKPSAKSKTHYNSGPNSSTSNTFPRNNHGSSPPSSLGVSAPVARSSNTMYNFPSRSTNNGATAVVDLTGSSPMSSPQRKSNARPSRPMASGMGPRKLVVKNLRPTSTSDPVQYLNTIWEKLDEALTIVFSRSDTKERLPFSMEQLYKGVENVCKQGKNGAETLCSRLQEKSRAYINNSLKAPLLGRFSEANVDILRAGIAAWKRWNEHLIIVQSIFFYLDRAYLLQFGRPSLREMAVALFRTSIFEDDRLQDRFVEGACDLVAEDRAGQAPDLSTFRDAVSLFHELSTYSTIFEPRLLELSQDFLYDWAEQESSQMSLAEYVSASHRLIKTEITRCELFGLDSSTRRELLALLESSLIEKHEHQLVADDKVGELLHDNSKDSLRELYNLLERRKLGSNLRPAFAKWVEDTGTAIIFDDKDYDNMVIKLLTLNHQLDTIWHTCFRRDPELGHGLRQSFEKFINKTKKSEGTHNTDNSKPGEMIAKYVDVLLRGGARVIPSQLSSINAGATREDEDENDMGMDEDSEVNRQLDQVLDLFRFVHGKAVFEAFYKRDLARRLLMNRSASADAERSMLTRLKTECGAGFTQNLEQMFRDVELAKEEMKSYNELLSDRQEKPGVDLNVHVLSASAWPTYPDIPLNLPVGITTALEKFDRHYKSKHSGRKLTWKHGLAHCQLKAKFQRGTKELVVSSFQAVVLLLFNDVGDRHMSYEQLKAETGLSDAELSRTLQSLACAKLRPLTKHPKGREINSTDTFTFNTAFDHPKYRVKINQVQLKETQAENKETHERVQVERSFETQAAIVRIMKSRKTITHNELVVEVVNATKSRGVLSVADIKKNIERLIDKDYMEREEDGTYSYIA